LPKPKQIKTFRKPKRKLSSQPTNAFLRETVYAGNLSQRDFEALLLNMGFNEKETLKAWRKFLKHGEIKIEIILASGRRNE